MITIRGAITVEQNTEEYILEETKELLQVIMKENNLKQDEVRAIIFTATKDITKAYPAVAARHIGLTDCSLICMQEMFVEGSLEMCIRVMFEVEKDIDQKDASHVYLKGAKVLRPDIAGNRNQIAIDGPAGAGKSTIAKLVAKELNFVYLDTGAMYRAIGYAAYENLGDSINDQEQLDAFIDENLNKYDVDIIYIEGSQCILLNGDDVSEKIRTQLMGECASIVSANPKVREDMVRRQKKIADKHDVVMDGRDIGTHVLPQAGLKIFLTASPDIRASRRMKQLEENGLKGDYETIKQEIIDRDERDMNREHAPLKRAKDAVLLDTSQMSIETAVNKIIDLYKG